MSIFGWLWPKSKKRISIAVVGIPASGKSYLLSDITTSLKGFDKTKVLTRNGVKYPSFSEYKVNIYGQDGVLNQTEMYPLRPTEKIYGAELSEAGSNFELDFADIPGEVFDATAKDGYTNLQVYVNYSRQLINDKSKNFYVTNWVNEGGKELKIVEPVLMGESKKQHNEQKKISPYFDIDKFTENRQKMFQDWPEMFSWLLTCHYREEKATRKKVSGKEIMENFEQYQPDTLMYSLAEKVSDICTGMNLTKTSFIASFMHPFYFLHYCKNATDIVICDKLLIHKDAPKENDKALIGYNTLVETLSDFVKGRDDKNVYLAFRGVDFMLQEKTENFKDLCNELREKGYQNKAIMNIVYSLFAYIVWSRVDPLNTIPSDEINKYLGVKHDLFNGKSIEELEKKYVDFNCGSGSTSTEIADGQSAFDALKDIIIPHVGTANTSSFMGLLKTAYGYKGADPSRPMRMMPPHVYFTCTPVTTNFDIYENDKDSAYHRFVNRKKSGPMKWFDTAGSHFCFGTYQLCLDILSQHGVNIIDTNEIGELLNISQRTE